MYLSLYLFIIYVIIYFVCVGAFQTGIDKRIEIYYKVQ